MTENDDREDPFNNERPEQIGGIPFKEIERNPYLAFTLPPDLRMLARSIFICRAFDEMEIVFRKNDWTELRLMADAVIQKAKM